MSVIGHSPLAGASGAAGGADPLYVDDVFSTFLYEASGATQTITNGIDLSGEGGMVWIKNRASGGSYTNHTVVDSERIGSNGHESLYPNLTDPEFNPTSTSNAVVTSFSSNGFTRGGNANVSNGENVSWTFRKAPGFFDVVTYSGTGSAQNISHSLGSVPGMIIIHCRDGSHDWEVYHRSTGATKSLHLNQNHAQATDSTVWNDTTPTSSVFTVGTSSNVNQNGHGYVAYVFAHDEQSFGTDSDEAIIKCGSYSGTGSAYNNINVGFEPQFVFFKNTSSAREWYVMDTMRGLTADGSNDQYLWPNTSNAEAGTSFMYPTATGFGFTATGGGANRSGDTYIYMAIRRPNKLPEAGTDVFNSTVATTGTATTGFPVDMQILSDKGYTNANLNHHVIDRLRGVSSTSTQKGNYLLTSSSASESSNYADSSKQWSNTGFDIPGNYAGQSSLYLSFRRAPGFFDVVAYRGDGSDLQTESHNLGAVPELMIVKARDYSGGRDWAVYSSVTGNSKFIYLHRDDAPLNTSIWRSTTPTSTQFTVGASATVNNSGTNYIAYLFATLDGISKIGSYSGTGSNVNVDCGFTAGARFVLIRRTDSSGDWYVWDTTRGIVSGNDPYLLLNSTAAEVTNTDYIDPLNAGFTVTSSAPAALNTSGGTYLFLAIA